MIIIPICIFLFMFIVTISSYVVAYIYYLRSHYTSPTLIMLAATRHMQDMLGMDFYNGHYCM